MIPWLGEDPVFPPLDTALAEPNGLLAAGGEPGSAAPPRRLPARHIPLVLGG
jgi:hypothetical protein